MTGSRALRFLLLALMAAPLTALMREARAEETKPALPTDVASVLSKAAPENVADLKAIQKQVRTVLDKVVPCTVGVSAGRSQGSGVIISADGYVLTAGHVSVEANREIRLILHDGRRVKAKTLGANRAIDSGLIKITEPGPWPHVEMGKSADLKRGNWCIVTGHPNGYVAGRTPVVRLGRVLESNEDFVRTDCTLVGGDSGGPLFDMQGRVIGINSRIGPFLTFNLHVPVDTYRDTWTLLAKGEVWQGPWLGFEADADSKMCKIDKVTKDSPAEKGGLKAEDVITRFDGRQIQSFAGLRAVLKSKKPGDEVDVIVQRGEESVSLKMVVGGRKPVEARNPAP